MAIPPRTSQNSTSNQDRSSRANSSTETTRHRPSWVNASVNLPSTTRITTESFDPRIEDQSSGRR